MIPSDQWSIDELWRKKFQGVWKIYKPNQLETKLKKNIITIILFFSQGNSFKTLFIVFATLFIVFATISEKETQTE